MAGAKETPGFIGRVWRQGNYLGQATNLAGPALNLVDVSREVPTLVTAAGDVEQPLPIRVADLLQQVIDLGGVDDAGTARHSDGAVRRGQRVQQKACQRRDLCPASL